MLTVDNGASLALVSRVQACQGRHGQSIKTADACRVLETDLRLLIQMCRGVLAEYGSVAKYCSDNASVPVLMMPPASASLEPADPGLSLLAELYVQSQPLWHPDGQRASIWLLVKACAEAASCALLRSKSDSRDSLDVHQSGLTQADQAWLHQGAGKS